MNLRGIVVASADLTGAVLEGLDLREADAAGAELVRSEMLHCDLSSADLSWAEQTGTVLRDCNLHDVRWDGTTAHHTEALYCRPVDVTRPPGWLTAPTATWTHMADRQPC